LRLWDTCKKRLTALAALIVAAVVLPLIFPPKGRAYLPPPKPKD
jgi:hypothetical protein